MARLGRTGPAAALLAALLLVPGLVAARDAGADGRFAERRSSHFVLRQDVDLDRYHGPHGSRAFERGVLDVLEAGHDALDLRLGLRPPRPLEVQVWDARIFDARFAPLFAFPAAGFYGGTIHVRGDVAVTLALQRTLLHELVHATLDACAPSLSLPAWLNEGLAEWFEARATGSGHLTPGAWDALAAAARGGRLPSLAALSGPSLSRLGAADAGLAYAYAHGLADHVARRHGERALRELTEDLVRRGDLVRAFERHAGADPVEVDAAFRRELAGR